MIFEVENIWDNMGIRYSISDKQYRVLMTSGGLGYGRRARVRQPFFIRVNATCTPLVRPTRCTDCVDALPPTLFLLYDITHAPPSGPRNGEAVQYHYEREPTPSLAERLMVFGSFLPSSNSAPHTVILINLRAGETDKSRS